MKLDSLQLSRALQLLLRTTPILVIRLGAVIAFWVVALIYLAVVGGVAWLVGQAIEIVGVILFIIALTGVIPLYQLAYRYVFFMLKAAHIAVISELLTNDNVPSGTNQLSWGKERVKERFGEVNVMFVVDELVTGVVKAFTNSVYRFTAWIPGDSVRTLVQVVNRVIQFAMNYIDEAVMSRSFTQQEKNVWANARDGVTLYAMVWKPLLMNAIALMIISYIPFVVALILFSAPVGFLLAAISPQLAGWAIIFTLILSYLIKTAVGDSFAMAAMIAAYHRETAGLQPNPEMTAKLDQVSDKFQELAQRAQEQVGRFTEHKDTPAPTKPDDAPPPIQPDADATT
ncbi:MAG: hypothetical protein CL610_02435 [Anaerolineaceae bacterium]|nr:hypothetical protein [Anaerolineaceae bacterium]